MGKTWLIYIYEYKRHVFRWRFLFILLSPLFAGIFFVVLTMLIISTEIDRSPVGYVDQAGVFRINKFPPDISYLLPSLDYLPFPDEATARTALEKKEIQAYYIIPSDFNQTRKARLVYMRLPNVSVTTQFKDLLRVNLLSDQPAALTRRVITGSRTIIELTSRTQKETINGFLQLIIPLGMSFVLIVLITMCAGYLVQAFVDERQNRTIEILATSASPAAILSGKILGLVSVGMTQLVIWAGIPLFGLFIFLAYFSVVQMAVDWISIIFLMGLIILSFFLFCTIIVMIFVVLGDSREGQSLTGLIMLIIFIPYILYEFLSKAPSNPLVFFLSLFPITSANTLAIRLAHTSVPAWQMVLSTVILLLTNIGAFWAAVKVFQKWFLLSGIQINWKRLLRKALHRSTRKEMV